MKTLADEIAELQELMEKATPGPWRPSQYLFPEKIVPGDDIASEQILANGAYVVAANPATMKRILDFNKECVEALEHCDHYHCECMSFNETGTIQHGKGCHARKAHDVLVKLKEPVE